MSCQNIDARMFTYTSNNFQQLYRELQNPNVIIWMKKQPSASYMPLHRNLYDEYHDGVHIGLGQLYRALKANNKQEFDATVKEFDTQLVPRMRLWLYDAYEDYNKFQR